MSGEYRITVRGVMSERFCKGIPGMRRHVIDDRTVLEGGPGSRPVNEVLAMLGNLGVEVIDVEEPAAAPRPEER
ncbi:MAG TPA: hypothetical protein VFG74_16625 [Miltoncostaeaceae bacterium]|jgi:hypothetical protein|nr:hypothetical protein [Miltoncostaeaceae bacterium]